MGFSSPVTVSGVSNSGPSDSLNGLKFGHKIYFEDVGVGAPARSGGGSSSSVAGSCGGPPAQAAAKKVKGVMQGGHPPRCQVEGCKVDLSDAKAYYSRHKVCGMHSKSPKVIVAGLEQRFCQQCSRFHLLSEFDQGKRSCRRRLAGHNERRRKPPPGSLFSSRYGRFSSTMFENSSRSGGILVNFSAYAIPSERDQRPTLRSSEWVPGIQTTSTGKCLPHSWQSSSESALSDLLMPSTAAGNRATRTTSGECFTTITNSSCALSLLSNPPWDSRNRASGLGTNNLITNFGTPIVQPTASQDATVNHVTNSLYFTSCSADGMTPDRCLGQISNHINGELSGAVELAQQSGRAVMELEHSRVYDDSQQMHWSL